MNCRTTAWARSARHVMIVGVMGLPITMIPNIARADGGSKQAAQALFDEGRRLMAAGEAAAACPKFEESERLDPGPGTLLNLGLCYEKSARRASAWATYKEAIAWSEKSARPEWAVKAREKAKALEPTLSTLTITVEDPSAPDLVVTRDGTEVGKGEWGLAIPVDGGEHRIVAKATGREAWSTSATVFEQGDKRAVAVPKLAMASIAAKPAPYEPSDTSSGRGKTQRTIGLIAGGVGIVGIGVGTFFGATAMSKNSDAAGQCNGDKSQCKPDGITAMADAKDAATISTISFIAGGAFLVGGIVLYFTAPKNSAVTTALMHVRPTVTDRSMGLGVGGSF